MKTIALILFTAVSMTLSAGTTNDSNDSATTLMSQEISTNARKWNYSQIECDTAVAVVFFRVHSDSTISVEDVRSDNTEMSQIVYDNLGGLELKGGYPDTTMLYNVRLVYYKQ